MTMANTTAMRMLLHAYPSSHDGGVDDEVHLLKDVTQDEWYCKLDDGSQGRAYRHVVYRL